MQFPCAVVVVEAVPLAEVLDLVSEFALRDDAFDDFERLQVFLLPLFVEEQYLFIFARERSVIDALLVQLVRFDVVVDALQALIAFKEFVVLVCVV